MWGWMSSRRRVVSCVCFGDMSRRTVRASTDADSQYPCVSKKTRVRSRVHNDKARMTLSWRRRTRVDSSKDWGSWDKIKLAARSMAASWPVFNFHWRDRSWIRARSNFLDMTEDLRWLSIDCASVSAFPTWAKRGISSDFLSVVAICDGVLSGRWRDEKSLVFGPFVFNSLA